MSTQHDPYVPPGPAAQAPSETPGQQTYAQPAYDQPAYAQPGYAYPATPGTYAAPAGGGKGLAIAALVVAVLALVAAGLALVLSVVALDTTSAPLGGGSGDVITGTLAQAEAGQPYAGADLADEVTRAVDSYYGPDAATGVTCPDLASVGAGESVSCSGTVLGVATTLEVVLSDDSGHFEVLESPAEG